MRAIETEATVTEEGTLIIPVPDDISPGQHHVVVVIEGQNENAPKPSSKLPLKLKIMRWENYPDHFTFRREDIYGDSSR